MEIDAEDDGVFFLLVEVLQKVSADESGKAGDEVFSHKCGNIGKGKGEGIGRDEVNSKE